MTATVMRRLAQLLHDVLYTLKPTGAGSIRVAARAVAVLVRDAAVRGPGGTHRLRSKHLRAWRPWPTPPHGITDIPARPSASSDRSPTSNSPSLSPTASPSTASPGRCSAASSTNSATTIACTHVTINVTEDDTHDASPLGPHSIPSCPMVSVRAPRLECPGWFRCRRRCLARVRRGGGCGRARNGGAGRMPGQGRRGGARRGRPWPAR